MLWKPRTSGLLAATLVFLLGGGSDGQSSQVHSQINVTAQRAQLPKPSEKPPNKSEQPKVEILTNDSVIQMLKAGIDEETIVLKIQKTERSFDLSTSGLVSLKQAGVSKALLQYMMDPTKPFELPKESEPRRGQSDTPPTQPPTEQAIADRAAVATATQIRQPSGSVKTALVEPERAATYDEFKSLLRERYNDKVVSIMVDGMYAGETGKGFLSGAGDTKLLYHHYHTSVSIPTRKRSNPLKLWGKKLNEMDQVDERTFGDLESLQVVPLQRGDPLKVDKIHVLDDRIEFNLISTSLKNLRDVDIRKSSTETYTTARPGSTEQRIIVPNVGFRFRFYFSEELLKHGQYRIVVDQINQYILPKDEAVGVLNAEKQVQIDPGMAEAEVLQRLGHPQRIITFADTKSLVYPGLTVVLKNGKVVEVKLQ